jgi:Tol biopolymer transport system component
VTDRRGVSNIWSTPLGSGRPRQITHFEDQRILKFAWSPAGDHLACLRESFGSDVALFTRQR